jgi:predicted aspartyl protease
MRFSLARLAALAALVLCPVALGVVAARAQSAQPADVLSTKGLSHAPGSTWILDGEALVVKAFKEVQAQRARLRNDEEQLLDFQTNQDPKAIAQAYRGEAAMIGQQIALLNQQGYGNRGGRYGNMALSQQRGQLQQRQQQLNAMAANAASQAPQFEEKKKQYNDRLEKLRKSHQEAVDSLRASVEKLMAKYTELAQDEPVVKALADLSTTSKIKQKLGPSKDLLTIVKWLGGLATVQTETIDVHREGGVDHVAVQLAGGSPVSMVLNTEAPQMVLPAALAAKLALKPTGRTVEWKAADGTAVTVPEMTIPLVKVGRMTAHEVACAVVPAEQGDVKPVLGQSFLQQFEYKLLPEANKLLLMSKAEAEQPATKSRGSTKSKSSGRSSKVAGKG